MGDSQYSSSLNLYSSSLTISNPDGFLSGTDSAQRNTAPWSFPSKNPSIRFLSLPIPPNTAPFAFNFRLVVLSRPSECPSMAVAPSTHLSSVRLRSSQGLALPSLRPHQKICFSASATGQSSRIPAEELRFDSKVETLLESVKWDDKGLAVAIAQNVNTGAILMQGFANREALATTISSRKATFYSRSRSSLWTKGETSNNFINVHDIFLDCDRDSIIYLGKPDGPTCHTGSETCFYSSVYDLLEGAQNKERLALTTLYSLEATISKRKDEKGAEENRKPSWTKRLLLDNELLCSKVREESGELVQTLLENEDRSRTASEMADLLYHAMVLLRVKDVEMEDVLEVLRKRFSQSGIEEKNSRGRPSN